MEFLTNARDQGGRLAELIGQKWNAFQRKYLRNSSDPLVHCLVKRCDQESVRAVEDRIIQTSQISEMVWRTDYSLTPVVVFCVVASRIGADIESAMRGVHDWSHVILIVLHNTHSTLLFGDLSDNEYLLDDELIRKSSGRIVHFAFSEHEELYSCRQNKEGSRKLMELLEKVWGPSPFLKKPWRQIKGWDESRRDEMRSKIIGIDPNQFGVQTINIILTGQIGAGKSSFYNSVNTIFSESVIPFKAPSGRTGRSFTKKFKMYPFTDNPNVRIGDTMGIDVTSSEVDIRNILKVVDGHVPNGYQLQSDTEFKSNDNPEYIQSPSLAERAHCVGLVINAHDFSNMKRDQLRKLQNLAEGINTRGIPLVIVLTHLDQFHPEVEEDITKTFHSRYLKELMVRISNVVHGIPENQIFPVINYHDEVHINVRKDVLLLYAVDFMINAAECYLKTDDA